MSQGHAMRRRGQSTQPLDQEMEPAEIANISADSNVAILTEMLNQTHINSQEEIIQENNILFGEDSSDKPRSSDDDIAKASKAAFHLNKNIDKKSRFESHREFLLKCIDEKIIPNSFIIRLEPSIGNHDEEYMKELYEDIEEFQLKRMTKTAKFCEKTIQEAEEKAKTCDEELKEVLDAEELQQVRCQVNLNNEINVRNMKQMKSRKFNALKYGKGRQTAPRRNEGAQQQRRWKSPQNQQNAWAPAPQNQQRTWAPAQQNKQQQSWANRTQLYRPPNKHQPNWDPWVQRTQASTNNEVDVMQNPQPIRKMDNVLKAVAPRIPPAFHQAIPNKGAQPVPARQPTVVPAPNYEPNTAIQYNAGQTTSTPNYQPTQLPKNLITAPTTQAASSGWSNHTQMDQMAQGLQEAIQAINVLTNQFKSFAGL